MNPLLDKLSRTAWQPVTPRGVTAFARARLGRLAVVQLVVATLAAVCLGWFLQTAWLPVVRDAIGSLPAEGEIRHGQLVWRGDTPVRLAANNFLSLGVDLWHEGNLGNESHLSLELGRTTIRVRSLLGYTEVEYPHDWIIAFNHDELVPWWGAWETWLLLCAGVAAALALFVSWTALATLYFLPLWLVAFFANRDLNFRQTWRLAGAALLPGALWMALAVVIYGTGIFDLVQLGMAFAFHILIGWIYAVAGVLLSPQHPEAAPQPKNPFVRS
jgi:hypothetical protein